MDAPIHELETKFEHLQAARYYIVAPVAVLYFDWLLTLSLEIDRFWKPRLTGPTVLFLINRYFPILSFIPTVYAYFSDAMTPEVCTKRIVPFVTTTNIISQSVIAIILSLRTYALYQQSRSILLLVTLSWAAATAVGAWGAQCIVLLELPPEISGCVLHVPDETKYRLAASYAGSLAFDTIIYGLTLWKTYCLRRARSCLRLSGDTLLSLVLRDGSVYFVVLLGANILSILLIYLAESDMRLINVTFTHLIPVTITSRLLLNLRRDVRRERAATNPGITLSTPVGDSDFTSAILGNIGDTSMFDSPSTFSGTKSWNTGHDSGYAGEEIALESIEVPQLRLGRTGEGKWDHNGINYD